MEALNKFKELDLPKVQKEFISQFDGTMENILTFKGLGLIINPTFSYHYFYVAGDRMENIVTTKHTDGSTASWGSQSKEAEQNAASLAHELKQVFKSCELFLIERCDVQEYTPYNPGKHRNKRKLFIKIGNTMIRIVGLTTLNIN